jgi:chromosome segregation ATPase
VSVSSSAGALRIPSTCTWFKQLGARIADPGAFAAAPDIAEPVLQAAKHFWGMAQAETRRDFDQRLSEGMAAAIANVEAEKERAAQSDAAAFEATNRLTHAQTQIADHLVIIETERLARATALADLANARQTVATLEARIAHNEEVLGAERAQHRSAVEAAERRAEGATRRAALEIEQERQSRASADKRAATAQSRLEAVHAELAEEKARGATSIEQLNSQLRLANRELELARASGAAEAGRVRELESQLAEAVSRADRAEAESGLAKTVLARLDIKRLKRRAPARSRAQGAA